MKIQISDIKSRNGRSKEINQHFKMDSFYFEGDEIRFASDVTIEGEVVTEKDLIILQANVKAKLNLTCSRCLETFIYPIDIDIEERFTNDKTISNDEVLFVEGDVIDITEITQNAIISSLPIQRLCKEDCKGLCQKCGTNLNYGTCTCSDADIDLRLIDLKALLDNKEV